MNALPRTLIKWLQALDLSYSIKNLNRDFVNGFLVAEILSKYYPSEVQMHSFDTGMAKGAKKNNWSMLERLFLKLGIPISSDVCLQAMMGKPHPTAILISIIYWHVHNKKSIPDGIMGGSAPLQTRKTKSDEVQGIKGQPVIGPFEDEEPQPPPQIELLTDIEPLTEELIFSKPSCIKTISTIFGLSDMHLNVIKNLFPSHARDLIINKIETHNFDAKTILLKLKEKEGEILNILQQNGSSEVAVVLDALVPCLLSYGLATNVFQGVSAMLYYFGDICHYVLQPGEGYKRLSSSRDFASLLQQISLPTMDKIPFISRLLHSFIGPKATDQDRLKIFLDLKNLINQNHATQSNKFGSQCIFFLASFNAIEDYPMHSNQSRLTLFNLSECLTIINSYHSSAERRQLLQNSCYRPQSPFQDTETVILTSLDLPALELSASLHVITAIIRGKVNSQHNVMSDVIQTCLVVLLKVVNLENCPPHFQKAYLNLLTSLLESWKNTDRVQEPLIGQCTLVLANLLQIATGDVLKTALLLSAPLLQYHPQLACSYLQGIMNLSEKAKTLFLTPSILNQRQLVNWELPFLLGSERTVVRDSQWGFSVIMGICRFVVEKTQPKQLDRPLLVVLKGVLQILLENESYKAIDAQEWENVFSHLSNAMISSLISNDVADLAWNAWTMFFPMCSQDTVINHFPSLLAMLVFLETTERYQCRRRLFHKIKKWLTKKDKDAIPQNYRCEVKRVVKLFNTMFLTVPGEEKGYNKIIESSSLF
ncbi:hypothetical protein EDD86DRAFT_191447 [Gorgonomyces haynaldii]|nr:hypothetical protein EDD86DRAFT_191447 [Gorgonomyces haynaldii]